MKNTKKLLVVTASKETWYKFSQYEIICLGEWCKLYPENYLWNGINSEVIPYHWDDRTKLKSDHDELKNLYEKVLIDLTLYLNKIHRINESTLFWRIVLGPWLMNYIPILFDRWEMLRLAFENDAKYISVLIENETLPIAVDFEGFCTLSQTDSWNQLIYQRIISKKYKDQIEFIKIKKEHDKESLSKPNMFNWKIKVIAIIDRIFRVFGGRGKFMFHTLYFSPINLILLNLKLKQFPRFFVDDFKFKFKEKVDNSLRKKLELKTLSSSPFELFLYENILKDIPMSYLEGFHSIRNHLDTINLEFKFILTANSYWGNDVFKIWIAIQQKLEKKIIISEHGGSFPPLFDTFQHEEEISSKFKIVWFNPFHLKHLKLPPNKIILQNAKYLKNGNCAIIGFESPRYSYRVTAGPISHQTLDCFEHTISFCSKLNDSIKENINIRPYPNLGWYTNLRYADMLSPKSVNAEGSHKNFIAKAKLIVCTYPQTTFSEAMASGKPTILVYDPQLFEFIPETKELIDILISAKIIFYDSCKAANHVNNIWLDIESWWENEKVVRARNSFLQISLSGNKNSINEWVKFLESI